MKRQREILSLGPCLVFILQKNYKKKNKKTSYLNVNKTKKDIGRFKENINGKKFLYWAQVFRQPGQSTL